MRGKSEDQATVTKGILRKTRGTGKNIINEIKSFPKKYVDVTQWKTKRGTLHRTNGPAWILEINNKTLEERWYKEGKLHRNSQDGPAVITEKEQKYYNNNLMHRPIEEGPALIAEKEKEYWEHGYLIAKENDKGKAYYKIFKGKNVLHRNQNEGPAVELKNGTKKYYRNGKLHRDNDSPAIVKADGTQEWYQNNKRHRNSDKPAMVKRNKKTGMEDFFWFQNGELHRDFLKGPAVARNGAMLPIKIDGKPINNVRGTVEYWHKGQKHHPYGPAIINYDTGEEEFWFAGVQYSSLEEMQNSSKKPKPIF